MDELEIIPHPQMANVRIFVNRVHYRSAHYHPEWELLWLLDEPLSIREAQNERTVPPGSLVLFPPNHPHELTKLHRPCTFLCFQISPRSFPLSAGISTGDILPDPWLTAQDRQWLCQTMLDTARAVWLREPLCQLYADSQCGLILHRLLRRLPCQVLTPEEMAAAERKNARLIRLVRFVEENYMHKLRLSDFARQEAKSVSYMSHFVKDSLNQTFQEYVNSVRFHCARNLIAEGKQSMVSISAASGFSDYRYFSRAFQQACGMTPAEYAQHAQTVLPGNVPPARMPMTSREEIFSVPQSLDMLDHFRRQLALCE